jgi:hypothetical protein
MDDLKKVYSRSKFTLSLSDNTFITFSLLAFVVFGSVLLLNHEMWRDEMRAWLHAKDSISLASVYRNMRYDGHPYLWYILLYIITRFTTQPIAMQICHLILAAGAGYIFLKYSLFTRLQKLFFILSYFPLYEYGIISRNYALGILLIFAFLGLFRASKDKNFLMLSCILFLLAQTNFFALIICVCLGCMVFFECIYDKELRRDLSQKKAEVGAAITLFILGIVLSILECTPPSDYRQVRVSTYEWYASIDLRYLGKVITAIWKSYIPIPAIQYDFWGTNIVSSEAVQLVFSIVLLGFFLLVFARKLVALCLYVCGTLGILSIVYVKFFGVGTLRHYGHLFVILVASLWISAYYPDQKTKWMVLNRWSNFCSRHKDKAITGIFIAQLIAGIIAGGFDLFYPFSGSKETANFIKNHSMENMPMMGNSHVATRAVAGYLNREIYCPPIIVREPLADSNKTIIMDIQELKNRRTADFGVELFGNNPEKLFQNARALMKQRKEDILLILNFDLHTLNKNILEYPLIKITESHDDIVQGEKFFLYVMQYKKPG